MRPVSVCHGLERSTLITNAVYRRPPDSEPDHSGEVITGVGRSCVSAKVICLPSCSAARSASGMPVRFSRLWNPDTARCPFVVPDIARIASHTWASRASDGRPSAMPPRTTPFFAPGTRPTRSGRTSRPWWWRRANRPAARAPRARGNRAIVALDHDELREVHARNRVDAVGLPVAHHPMRVGQLVRSVVQQRHGDEILADAQVRRGKLAEPPRPASGTRRSRYGSARAAGSPE